MKVLVTGASGMLGPPSPTALAARGDDVTVLQRRPRDSRHREVLGDIADRDAVRRARSRGHDAVRAPGREGRRPGPVPRSSPAPTSTAPATVVAACRRAGVPRLVHVSSPVGRARGCRAGRRPAGPGGPAPRARALRRSKAVAELLALAADAAPDGPAVVAVRPHLVWGPGDTQLVGRIVARARPGGCPVVGSGAALIDTTYVDNAADALVAALDRCAEARGQALVVSNGEPRPVAELLAAICRAAGVRAPAPRRAAALARVGGSGRGGGRGRCAPARTTRR